MVLDPVVEVLLTRVVVPPQVSQTVVGMIAVREEARGRSVVGGVLGLGEIRVKVRALEEEVVVGLVPSRQGLEQALGEDLEVCLIYSPISVCLPLPVCNGTIKAMIILDILSLFVQQFKIDSHSFSILTLGMIKHHLVVTNKLCINKLSVSNALFLHS